MPSSKFDWSSKEACNAYEQNWEISTDEVHYGWLSPGESSIGLLSNFPSGAKALDVGCGMGENIVALHRMGLDAYGLDLSSHMVRKARSKLRIEGTETTPYRLRKRVQECDARTIAAAFKEKFDVILSVYSLEFFPNIAEFRRAIASIVGNLERGGTFVLCVSHPAGQPAYPHITNETVSVGTSEVDVLLYSIRDVVNALCDSHLTIDRVVEQKTTRPSQVSYEEGRQYPYHFRQDKNPFSSLFDDLNENPHTLICRSRKGS